MIIIYTDGSARGNPGRGGYGAIIIGEKTALELGGREEYTTNNRMELRAAIEAFSYLLRTKSTDKNVTVYTDSQYVIKGITEWIVGWQKNNWKGSNKKPVLNKDLWEDLLSVTREYVVIWKYVRGHVGDVGNERADTLATSFADTIVEPLFHGTKEDYIQIYKGIV